MRRSRHAAPAPDCECGIHAWHPTRSGARRVLASRREVAGVVEAEGAIEVHQRRLPRRARAAVRAAASAPHANARLVAPARGRLRRRRRSASTAPDAIVAWCRARGLGLDAGGGRASCSGPSAVAAARRERRRRARTSVLRVAAALAAIAVLRLDRPRRRRATLATGRCTGGPARSTCGEGGRGRPGALLRRAWCAASTAAFGERDRPVRMMRGGLAWYAPLPAPHARRRNAALLPASCGA